MKKRFALILSAALAITGAVQAQPSVVVGDFEGGSFDGWTSEEGAILTLDTFGATLGTGSLKIVAPSGWKKIAKVDVKNHLPLLSQAGTTVSLDLTMRNDDGSIPGWWQQTHLILNSDGGGWFDLGRKEPGVPWSPTTYHLSWTIPAAQASAVANSTQWVEFFLINNCDPSAVLFFDNIVITVPEPATAALLGLGLAGLLVFRRRNS